MEENADAKGGGEQRWTLTSRRTAEYDTERTMPAPEEDGGEGLWRITEEDGVRRWCRGGGERRRTLAPRRKRNEENADSGEGGEQRRTLALRRRRMLASRSTTLVI